MVEVDSSDARGVNDMFVMIPEVPLVWPNGLNVFGLAISSELEVDILLELRGFM